MRRTRIVWLASLLAVVSTRVLAQLPNSATTIVIVSDQTGGVVRDARVSVINGATGATRTAVSGGNGAATIAGLSLTGDYRVSLAKEGFAADDVTGLALRAGETATVRMQLVVSG